MKYGNKPFPCCCLCLWPYSLLHNLARFLCCTWRMFKLLNIKSLQILYDVQKAVERNYDFIVTEKYVISV